MAKHSESNIAEQISEDTRYMLFRRLEILGIMKRLAQSRDIVSAVFGSSQQLLVTVILQVDADNNRLILDYGPDASINQQIIKAQKIDFETRLDSVKIQFNSQQIELCVFDGRDAFAIPLPQQLLRLQRREYYRLATPIICHIPFTNGFKDASLIDISIGGIGLALGQADIDLLELGYTYADCRIKLPDIGMVTVTLLVQNKFETTMKNGKKCFRVGCLFVDVKANAQSLVQRYILKLERELVR